MLYSLFVTVLTKILTVGTLLVTPAYTWGQIPWSLTLPVPAGVITSLVLPAKSGLDMSWETTTDVLSLHCISSDSLEVSLNTPKEVRLSVTTDYLSLDATGGQKPTASTDDLVAYLKETMVTPPLNGLGCMLSRQSIHNLGFNPWFNTTDQWNTYPSVREP